jgi:hypothetical protein
LVAALSWSVIAAVPPLNGTLLISLSVLSLVMLVSSIDLVTP